MIMETSNYVQLSASRPYTVLDLTITEAAGAINSEVGIVRGMMELPRAVGKP